MEELSYSTVFTVIESWEALRQKRAFNETMGRGLLIKFFQERPDAMSIFGFQIERGDHSDSNSDQSSHHDEEEEEKESEEEIILYRSEKFIDTGKNFVNFMNQAVDMLGPDLETFSDILVDLGDKHHLNQYNLSSKFYPILGRALLAQVEEMLGPDIFTIQTRGAWLQVFQAISLDLTPPSVEPEPEPTSERKSKKKSPTFFRNKRLSNERRNSGERRKSHEKRNSHEKRLSK